MMPESAPAAGDAGMFVPAATVGTVLCCMCGVAMQPNPANMCARCLRTRVDITEGVPRHAAVVYCPDCSSYLQPPRSWLRAGPESPELMQILLRRINRPLARLRVSLSGAEFVFSEPHSKRLRLKLRLRLEVLHGIVLEQTHPVEFVVHDRLCDSCSRAQANPDQWVAVVQLRQHVPHRRTFLYLVQLLIKHGQASLAIRVAAAPGGLDFFFGSRSHAARLVDFLFQRAAPLPLPRASRLARACAARASSAARACFAGWVGRSSVGKMVRFNTVNVKSGRSVTMSTNFGLMAHRLLNQEILRASSLPPNPNFIEPVRIDHGSPSPLRLAGYPMNGQPMDLEQLGVLQSSSMGWNGAPGVVGRHIMKKVVRIDVPVDKYPNFNFVGRLLGPRGNSLKRVEATTQCRVFIRGRGSVKDSVKEDKLRDKPGYEHLNDPLHVLVDGEFPADIIDARLNQAVAILEDLLKPVDESMDYYKKQQLRELAILNGTLRVESPSSRLSPSVSPFNSTSMKRAKTGR